MANPRKLSSVPVAKPKNRTTAKSCVPKNANWFVKKYQTWFKGAKLCGKPDTPKANPKGIGSHADSVMEAHKKAEREGRKPTRAELAKAFFFPKK